jgi:hypothetical protein
MAMENLTKVEPAIERFADIARRYCDWAAGSPSGPEQDLRRARLLLTELYHAALNLPDVECGEDIESVPVSPETWKAVCQRFSGLPVSGYWDVFDPLNPEGEAPVFSVLADDFGDIYRDLKESLLLFDGGHIVEAAWEWRFSFRTHWGRHLIGALHALHAHLDKEV